MDLFGRRKIFTVVDEITEDNVLDVLNDVLAIHFENMAEEEYLYWYRRGKQPVLNRTKKIRSDINNKIVQNVATEIVSFKNGYFLTKPTFYVERKDKGRADEINQLNDYIYASGKHEADNDIVDNFHTMGVGVCFVKSTNEEDTPFKAYSLDPRRAFDAYSTSAGSDPVMGVNIALQGTEDKQTKAIFDVFTKKKIYRVEGSVVSSITSPFVYRGIATKLLTEQTEDNALGEIPIIEYTYDKNRMSSFEACISLLDAINNIQSDRENGVQQFIQSLMVLTNCTLGEDEDGNPITAQAIREAGLIELKSNSTEGAAKVDILSDQLDQTQTQVLIDDLLHQVCNIAGMPFTTDAQGGTSDNNGAVYLRNGWQTADTFARNTEDLFRASNKQFDKIVLKILMQKSLLDLKVSDIDIQFTRNEMENVMVKTQAALNMKELGLSPEIVLARSGISNDPSGDVAKSKDYIEAKFETKADKEAAAERQMQMVTMSKTGEENDDRQRDSREDKGAEKANNR